VIYGQQVIKPQIIACAVSDEVTEENVHVFGGSCE